MEDKVKLTVVKRFNHRDPGETFDADPADAKSWIKAGLAKKAGAKGAEAPPEDKVIKKPAKKK